MSGLVRLCSEGAGWARYMQCVACPRPPSRTRPSTQKLDILILLVVRCDTSVPYIVSYRARRIKDSYLDEARVRVAGAVPRFDACVYGIIECFKLRPRAVFPVRVGHVLGS